MQIKKERKKERKKKERTKERKKERQVERTKERKKGGKKERERKRERKKEGRTEGRRERKYCRYVEVPIVKLVHEQLTCPGLAATYTNLFTRFTIMQNVENLQLLVSY